MAFRTIRHAASVAFLAGASLAQGTLFPVSHWYQTGDAPTGGTLADLNGDGNLDCVVANHFSDKVSVYLGTGTGQLTPQPLLAVGAEPRRLVVADMNGDTKPDLVTVNSTSDSVSVLLGDGAGGFGGPVVFPAGAFPVCIDAGDLDGDGDMDIVTGNQASNRLTVLLGNGAGALGAPTSFQVGCTPERIELADMNGDGKLDCVTAGWFDDLVVVSLGNGTGSLTIGSSVLTPTPRGLAVGDVNGDGRPDVLTASSQQDVVYVYLGNSSGLLDPPKYFFLGSGVDNPTSVMITDASGDGRPDFIACADISKTLTVFIGVGGGDFGFALTSAIPETPYDALAGDLDGDGFADVVTMHTVWDSIRVHVGAGVGSWQHYCTAKTNSLGCVPVIYAIGTPSVSNPRPFRVYVTQVFDYKVGMFLYTVNGSQASIPFQGGTLCVGPSGVKRTPAKSSGGTLEHPSPNCMGKYSLDFNAFAQGLAGGNPSPGLLVIGNTYQTQVWSRDPGFPAPNNSGLTAALDVTPWL